MKKMNAFNDLVVKQIYYDKNKTIVEFENNQFLWITIDPNQPAELNIWELN